MTSLNLLSTAALVIAVGATAIARLRRAKSQQIAVSARRPRRR